MPETQAQFMRRPHFSLGLRPLAFYLENGIDARLMPQRQRQFRAREMVPQHMDALHEWRQNGLVLLVARVHLLAFGPRKRVDGLDGHRQQIDQSAAGVVARLVVAVDVVHRVAHEGGRNGQYGLDVQAAATVGTAAIVLARAALVPVRRLVVVAAAGREHFDHIADDRRIEAAGISAATVGVAVHELAQAAQDLQYTGAAILCARVQGVKMM